MRDKNPAETGAKVAWVVGLGPTHGTGAAVAKRFAEDGFTVVVTGRSADRLEQEARSIQSAGGIAISAPGDASREEDLLAILSRIENID